jgi:GRAM domain
MRTDLQPGETVIKESRANLQRGTQAVGGHLVLTNQRLVFEDHRFNVQRAPAEFALADVVSVRSVWTKVLNVFPLAPNSIAVTVRDGRELRFAVPKRNEWREALTPRGA